MNLIIPNKTLQDNFNLADFQSDFSNIDLAKQDKTDNTLTTISKNIVGAINENTTSLLGKVNKTIQTFKPTLINGWGSYVSWNPSYGDLIYYKDDMGIVHIEGTLSCGNTPYPFILPVGFRPSKHILATASVLQGTTGPTIKSLQVIIEKDSGNVGLFGFLATDSRVAINVAFKLI